MEFDKGYISAYMITNAERMEAEAKDVSILITDKKISTVKDILPLLEKVAQSGKKDLVIIAVKAHHIPLLLPGIRQLFGPRTMVMTVQNGVPWWYFYGTGGPYEGRTIAACGKASHRRSGSFSATS